MSGLLVRLLRHSIALSGSLGCVMALIAAAPAQALETLIVTKVISPDPLSVGSVTQFQITVTCTPPAGPPTVPYPVSVTGAAPNQTIGNLVAGSRCYTSEALPPPFASNNQTCTWQPPTYSPQPIIIASGTNTVTVINSYQCGGSASPSPPIGGIFGPGVVPGSTGYLMIRKVVVDNTGGTPVTAKFPIWLSCSNFIPGTWLSVPIAGGKHSTNYPLDPDFSGAAPSPAGITCTVTENVGSATPLGSKPLPQIPTTACQSGFAAWTTTYSPSSGPFTGAVQIPVNAIGTVTVTNRLDCVP